MQSTLQTVINHCKVKKKRDISNCNPELFVRLLQTVGNLLTLGLGCIKSNTVDTDGYPFERSSLTFVSALSLTLCSELHK